MIAYKTLRPPNPPTPQSRSVNITEIRTVQIRLGFVNRYDSHFPKVLSFPLFSFQWWVSVLTCAGISTTARHLPKMPLPCGLLLLSAFGVGTCLRCQLWDILALIVYSWLLPERSNSQFVCILVVCLEKEGGDGGGVMIAGVAQTCAHYRKKTFPNRLKCTLQH